MVAKGNRYVGGRNVGRAGRNWRSGAAFAFQSRASFVVASREAIDEAVEDVKLNAIADERADGPFIRVSLDDL